MKTVQASFIEPNEHVFIAGRTGTGKTFLARQYLPGFNHVVIHDTKGEFGWSEIGFHRIEKEDKTIYYRNDNKEEITMVRSLYDLPKVKTPKIIYKPGFEELNQDAYNLFYQWIYMRQHCIVLVDESMNVSPNPHIIPEYYKGCLTRGRELGIGVWSCSQRPAGIAQIIISESNHIFSYDLNLPQDRKKMAEVTGATEFLDKPGYRKFWYFNAAKGDSAILARLKVK